MACVIAHFISVAANCHFLIVLLTSGRPPLNMKPIVLIATTKCWFSTARLAMGLAKAGFGVEAICPIHHPLARTTVVRKRHPYLGHAPLRSFSDAITAAEPNLLVPADDVATRQLHQLHDRERRNGKAGQAVCALIERSLGNSENFPTLERRAAIMQLAHEAGIRVPQTEVIASAADLEKWFNRFSFPVVLKADGTSGGAGVRVVYSLGEAKRAFRELQGILRVSHWPIRNLIRRSKSLLAPSMLRDPSIINAQVFIQGCDAISEVACWEGKVLASLHFQVLDKQYSHGPASVVRLIENAGMEFAIETMARQLGLSGLHGFDFVLEEATGHAYLIEINPRATQVGHLTFGPGRDLPAALYAAATEEPLRVAPKLTEKDTVALFPQEWTRDQMSVYLESGYHDVPWDEPALVRNGFLSSSDPHSRPAQHEHPMRDLSAAPILRP